MMWYTHLIFAMLIFLVVKLPLKWPWLALPVCLLASLMPDIDTHRSKLGRKAGFVSRLIEILFNHRGIVHSIFAALAFFVLLFTASATIGISPVYSYAFVLGYISHLFLDSLNPYGVAWLAPLTGKRVRSKIRTNGIGETIVLVLISALTVANIVKIVL